MKRFLIFLLIFYSIVATYFAYPTIRIIFENEKNSNLKLDSNIINDQSIFSQNFAYLLQYADSLGYKVTLGECYRTMYQQRYYVAKGLSWTYNSNHLKRKACDINLFINDKITYDKKDFAKLGRYWEYLDPRNVWGGAFSDFPHFEMRNSIKESKKYQRRNSKYYKSIGIDND
jgi:hypothetical protein